MTAEKKGITVKVDAGLHAEVRRYLEENGLTMAELVAQALQDELHPKLEENLWEKCGRLLFRCQRNFSGKSRTTCSAII